MIVSAKAFFEDNTASNILLIKQAEVSMPKKWLIEFRRAARGAAPGTIGTPKKTGALRRSIITQAIGGRAQVGWRLPYAAAQEAGGHKGATYSNYTTENTGAGFAQAAFRYANSQLPQIVRSEGLIK